MLILSSFILLYLVQLHIFLLPIILLFHLRAFNFDKLFLGS